MILFQLLSLFPATQYVINLKKSLCLEGDSIHTLSGYCFLKLLLHHNHIPHTDTHFIGTLKCSHVKEVLIKDE